MCDCIDAVNAKLAEHNTQLEINLLARPVHVMVATCKLVWGPPRRGKPVLMAATYCPFCGVAYKSKSIFKETPPHDTSQPRSNPARTRGSL